MPSQTYLSFANLLQAATLTASSSAAGFPVANLSDHARPGLPWRSTGVGDSWVVADFGSATPFDRHIIAGVNFATYKIQQHTSDSWGSPAWDSGTLSTSLDFERRKLRRWVASPANFTRQFTRIFIPAQAPLTGAGYFEIQWAWAGLFTQLPKSPRPDYTPETVDPMLRQEADLGQWATELVTGDSYARHVYERIATKTPATPGQGDEYGAWLDVDRSIAAVRRRFCYVVENWGPGAAYFMRQVSRATWPDVGRVLARGPWELEECVSG